MDDLESVYLERLSPYLGSLKNAKQALKDVLHAEWREAVRAIHKISHTLKESGKTYGYPKISEAAGLVEEAGKDEIIERMDALIDVLEELLGDSQDVKTVILIIEDNPAISQLLRVKLSNPNRKVLIAGTAHHAQEILSEREVSLILLDLTVLDAGNRDLLATLEKMIVASGTPVMFLSDKDSTVSGSDYFTSGTMDVLEKPFDPEILVSAIIVKLNLRAAQSHKFLWRQDVIIAIMEIDHFKSLTDAYGLPLGDEVFHRVTEIITKTIRKSDHLDICNRERFIVIFSDTHLEGAVKALEKTLVEVQKERFQTVFDSTLRVTFSAGIGELKENGDIKEAVVEADNFLQQAKSSGRDGVILARSRLLTSQGTVIIAEDDDLTASVVRHRLELDGFKVKHFRDGASALAAAKETTVSLFILDVKMSVMDGFELIENIRRVKALANTPIVMLSSMGREKDIVRAFELGADDYVRKPFSPEELKARIHRLLMREKWKR